MIGNKHISDLITDPSALLQGRINIIDAGVSAGKTHFALTVIPKWTAPERILYLIDTTNGEMRIQRNMIAIGRMDYAFYDYSRGECWGEAADNKHKMPVMTYAGFGSEILRQKKKGTKFNWFDFDYIICDEMQNLVDYQRFNERSTNLENAERELRKIVAAGTTTIIAMSATPQKIRERFGELCYDVPFDRSDLIQLETAEIIPYDGKVQDLLLSLRGKRGILYTTEISHMKRYIDYANSIGMRANGFWSTSTTAQKEHPFTRQQLDLREMVLSQEAIPDDLDLLAINRASETCIKIQAEKSSIDFIIVHDKSKEIQTQVRGRYHGDLDEFYYHDTDDAVLYQLRKAQIPSYYFGKRLYSDDWYDLIHILNLRRPNGTPYGKPTLFKLLPQCGYSLSDPKKDSGSNGKYYRILSHGDTISTLSL